MASEHKLRALLSPKISAALAAASKALRDAGIEYALCGGLALDHHADEPRFTCDVDFIVDPADWESAAEAIQSVGFDRGDLDDMLTQLENKDGVRIDLLFGVGDPEESARVTAKKATVLGVRGVPVVASEYLVWMYLLSDQRRHEEDAERLIAQGIDLNKLAGWLRQTGSRHELARLGGMVARVRGRRDRGQAIPTSKRKASPKRHAVATPKRVSRKV